MQYEKRQPSTSRPLRSSKPSLNPYFMDDIGFTLTDLLRSRSAAEEARAAR